MHRTFAMSLISICFAFADLATTPAWSQHHTPPEGLSVLPQAGPANAEVELENESVIVVRIRMAPHEKTPMHDIASARLVVWLTDVRSRDTHPDGSADETRRKAGDIDWVPVQRHAGENLSDQPLEFLAIVPKVAPAAHRAR